MKIKKIQRVLFVGITFLSLTACTPCNVRHASENDFSKMVSVPHFQFDKAQLALEDKNELDRFAAYLSAHPKKSVYIEGYTDAQGSETYNHALGIKRAQAVAKYLESKGIDNSRLNINSFGSHNLVDTRMTKEANALNRRAVIYVQENKLA